MSASILNNRKFIPSAVAYGHLDYEILEPISFDIHERVSDLEATLPEQILSAFEFVLDPVRTGRTKLSDLDNVEKTFVGLKVEHFIRNMLGAPKGIRDLVLAGQNVDVKNTVGHNWAWMIPPETYKNDEPCLLVAFDEQRWKTWMGLFVARLDYLGEPNRDGKRGILKASYQHILWLVEGAFLPRNRWEGVNMERFLQLRQIHGGTLRAATFFRENLGRPVHRSVLLSLLFDQLDPMKRLRGNGGAKDLLKGVGIALLSGAQRNNLLEKLGLPTIGLDEHIAVYPSSPAQRELLICAGELCQRAPIFGQERMFG